MTQAPASPLRKPVEMGSYAPRAQSRTKSTVVPLSEARRVRNRKSIGLSVELRCECAAPSCRETVPAAADDYRGTMDRFIIAPAHLNGGTVVRAADRFFVVESHRRVGRV